MPELFVETGQSEDVTVNAPILQPLFIPSIDKSEVEDGFGFNIPFGGGPSRRSYADYGVQGGLSAGDTLLNDISNAVIAPGNAVSYNFEGAIGPQGPPGPPGPPGTIGLIGLPNPNSSFLAALPDNLDKINDLGTAADKLVYTSAYTPYGDVAWTMRLFEEVGSQTWSVASDSDGSHLIAGYSTGRLYTSSDYGDNWTQRQPAGDTDNNWQSVASDADGSNLIAVISSGTMGIYTSADYGANWTERLIFGGANTIYSRVASNDDGTVLAVTCHKSDLTDGGVYVSTNSGVDWSRKTGISTAYYGIDMSSDGSHIIAGVSGGRLYTSTDYGDNWTERQPAGDVSASWLAVASDSDGSHLIAADWTGRLYTSSDYGDNWTQRQPAGDGDKLWVTVASNSDGTYLIAAIHDGQFYMSTDGGVSWTIETPGGATNKNWKTADFNSDGTRAIASTNTILLTTLFTESYALATWAEAALTSAGRDILADETSSDQRDTLGLGTGDDVTFNDLTISTPSNIYALSHDSFADFVADEHVAHSGVTITAGTGLSGGGTIDGNITIDCDVTQYSDELAQDAIGTILDDGTVGGIVFTYDDATPKISAVVQAGEVDHDSLQNTHNLTTDIDHDNIVNGGAHDYSYVSGNDGATDVTAAQLEELSDGSETTLHSHAAGAPAAHTHDGDTLQLDGINSDGGAFSFTTSGGVVFSNSIIMADGEAIGQSAGPIVRFDDSNNYLEITQCDVGINMTAPSAKLHVSDDGNAVAASLVSNDCTILSAEGAACGASIVVASGTGTHRGVFKGVKSAGTLATPTVPSSGDQVLSFLGAIFDGTDTEGTAAVDFVVDGNVSSNVAPQRIGFYTSATNAAGRTERLTIKSNGKIGINSPAIPHGGVGAALLALDSTDSSVNGPHMQFTTANDDYPLLQILPYAHDNVNLVFDAYFDGAWKSSDASSNFKITKTATGLGMLWDGTVAQGSAVTWNNGVALNQNGNWIIYNTQYLLERAAAFTDATGYGQIWVKSDAPNTLWFTNDDGTDYQLGVGSNHAILDGSVHTDSVADAVTRGSIIYGNATPKWDELGLGAADTFLGSDGTDLSYRTAAQTLASLSGEATAAFDWNGQDLTNGGVLFLTEQAAGESNVAGKGQFWVKTVTPNEAYFQDDAGTDWRLGVHFVDRGDPAAVDFAVGDLTTDGAWHDLDLSSIVPAGAKGVVLATRVMDDTVGYVLLLRKNGNSNAINVSASRVQVANNLIDYDAVVACDSNRVIEYLTNNDTYTTIDITVKGWFV